MIDSAQIAIIKRLIELGDDFCFWHDLREDLPEKVKEWQNLRSQISHLGGVDSLSE